MTVGSHLNELRRRIVYSLLAFLAGAIFAFTQVKYLRQLLISSAEDMRLAYFSPPEALMADIRLAVIAGLIISAPVIIYQALAFLFPGLYRHEKIIMFKALGTATFLFVAGVSFAYFVVLHLVLHFFLRFETSALRPLFNISSYISFFTTLHLAFGIFFQLPLAMWILGALELVSGDYFKKHRKYAILVMLVAGSLLTPPDIISQLMLVGPLTVLYEMGIISVRINERKRQRQLQR